MAAPEYLIKLKFGTEVDKKAFSEIQAAYDKISEKERRAFAKTHNTSVQELNKLFKKETQSSLKSYERAATKTESTLTKTRVAELRKYITKRNEQLKRLPRFAAGALGTSALGIANAGISSSLSLTQFDKNALSKTLNMGAAGAGLGLFGGPIGVAVGAAIGATTGAIMAELENSSDKIKQSASLFNTAVSAYRATLNVTAPLDTDMKAAGFTDMGQYLTYRNALASAGITNDAVLENIFRAISSQSGSEAFGAQLLASRPDEAIAEIERRFKASGLDPRSFIMGSKEQGGMDLGRAGMPLIRILSEGWDKLIQEELQGARKFGLVGIGQDAAVMSDFLEQNERKRKELERNDRWQAVAQNKMIQDIDMNESIMSEANQSFARTVRSMKEHELLLEGVKELYKSHARELAQIFAEITNRTHKGTTFAEGASNALRTGGWEGFRDYVSHGGLGYSPIQPMANKLDAAGNRVNQTRINAKTNSIMYQ